MRNWKTTLTGVISALPSILGWFGVPIPADVSHAFVVAGLFVIGLVSKDHNVTGDGK